MQNWRIKQNLKDFRFKAYWFMRDVFPTLEKSKENAWLNWKRTEIKKKKLQIQIGKIK